MQNHANLRWHPQNNIFAMKNILLLTAYTEFTKHVKFYLPLPISVIVKVSAFIFLTLTTNIPTIFTAIPQHIISPIHYIGHTALLKTLNNHFWWNMLPCHYDPHWLNNTYISFGLQTDLNSWKFTIFSTEGVSSIQNLKYICSGFCVVSVQVHGFYGF